MNILLVEDEMRVASFIKRGLSAEGWTVDHVSEGRSTFSMVEANAYDVILLDRMLPDTEGHDVCRKLRARKSKAPIMMLTALDSPEEKVEGLRVGADDYLTKPFDFDELITRIEALHRRATDYAIGSEDTLLTNGALEFDRASLVVKLDGKNIDLSKKERDLLLLLMSNQDRVLSRERILNSVWGLDADPLTNVVDVYIGRLRRKLETVGKRIETLRNVGYRMIKAS